MASSFHVENFGCRAARADGEAIADRLAEAGCHARPLPEAEVVVVNTCSVTAEADRRARAFLRRAHRLNPHARIVVTGCYAQRAPQELARIDGVTTVVGNSHKALAPELILELLNGGSTSRGESGSLVQIAPAPAVLADGRFAHSFLEEAQVSPGGQTRPNLKIQEGCSNRCTFCVIPETRGPSRSLPAEAVLRQVRGFVAAGGNELVLSGINLGRWGFDLPAENRPRLSVLVRRILDETALPLLRLSSIEPMDWDADLIALLAEHGGRRIARHAHLPLQSGSDAVLRRMHRRYRPWHYAEKAAALLAACPGLTLGADVMAGFPSESETEFAETMSFLEALPFGSLHLFPFSPRPATPAEEWHKATPVSRKAVEERMAALRELVARKSAAHRRGFVGSTLPTITLHTPATLTRRNRTAALSDNFLPVEIEGRIEANRLVRVAIGEAADSPRQGTVLVGHAMK